MTTPAHNRPSDALLGRFREAFDGDPDFVVRSPGRVTLLGAHVDVHGGYVLPAAINRSVWLAVKRLPTTLVTLLAFDMDGEEVAFRLTELDTKHTLIGKPLPDWARYAAGTAWSLQEENLPTPGTRLTLASDIPAGAGLGSSGAVETAYAAAWQHITGWEVDRMQLAQLCQRAENEYMGVDCGLTDPFASLFGKAGHALLLDTRSREWEALPLPDDAALVVADTGTRSFRSESPFNRRIDEAKEALAALKQHLPEIEALRDVSPEDFREHAESIPAPARLRAQHVVEENARVQAAADALRSGDAKTLGRLMDASYRSSRDLYDAGGPALEAMWQAAQEHPARLGGRFPGGGWAGAMVFLVQKGGLEDFIERTGALYTRETGEDCTLYPVEAADGTEVIELS